MNRPGQSSERGSALIVALLVMVIMTLLGIPFLLMGETENRIAENERLSLQALYAAESGARMVKRWIDHPADATNLLNPPLAAVHRTSRMIDADGDPGTPTEAADGSPELPYYKQDNDALFDKPYRGSLVDSLVGTEDAPDMRIHAGDSTDAAVFLDTLSKTLFGGTPSALRVAAVNRIDIYAPPVIESVGEWTRYGIGTAKVTAGVYQDQPDGSRLVLAERVVRFVFNEVPYNNKSLGAMHTCDDLAFPDDLKAHWGLVTAKDKVQLEPDHHHLPASLARATTTTPSLTVDPLWNGDGDDFDDYKTAIDGATIEDPWIRLIAGGDLDMAGAPGDKQPWPFEWDPSTGVLGDEQLTYHFDPPAPATPLDGSHSFVFQDSDIGCPTYSYDVWKRIAQNGGPNVRYFTWVTDQMFSENGTGPPTDFKDLTDNQSGFYFFDTRDGNEPDGSNETPDIHLVGGTWSFRGFLYLNSELFQAEGVAGRTIDFEPPGEPFLDENDNGRWDAGEEWINLQYPTTFGSEIKAKADDLYGAPPGGDPVWNARGPAIQGEAHVWGIVYNSGYMDSTGDLVFYGSAIADDGFSDCDSIAGTPEAYWDQTLAGDAWPPPELGLPRVVVTRWETGL